MFTYSKHILFVDLIYVLNSLLFPIVALLCPYCGAEPEIRELKTVPKVFHFGCTPTSGRVNNNHPPKTRHPPKCSGVHKSSSFRNQLGSDRDAVASKLVSQENTCLRLPLSFCFVFSFLFFCDNISFLFVCICGVVDPTLSGIW